MVETIGRREAEEHLRIIREVMERSTRHSTLSGLSGVLAGSAAVAGALLARFWAGDDLTRLALVWGAVLLFSVAVDFALTKRRAAAVGKRLFSRLGWQMARAALPGLAVGLVLTLLLLRIGRPELVYPIWMLAYGLAVSAVGVVSRIEVTVFGWAFLAAGIASLLLPDAWGVWMMALSFGGFHIAYGAWMSRKDGW